MMRLLATAIIAALVGAAAGFAVGWIAADRNDGSDADLAAEERLARTAVATKLPPECRDCELLAAEHIGDRTWVVRFRNPARTEHPITCLAVDLDDVGLGESDYSGIDEIGCDAVPPEQ
jgi:hypothetical protein